MKKLVQLILIAGLSVIFISACVSKPKTTDISELSEIKKPTTGFLMEYNFSVEDSVIGENGCVVELKNAVTGSHTQVEVKYGYHQFLAEVPAGIYYFHNLDCARKNWDLNTNIVPSFKVEENKISLTAPVVIKISDKYRIHFNYYGRKESRFQSLAIWGSISDQIKPNLISGYTLTPISLELIEGTESWDDTEVSTDGVHFKKVKRGQFTHFKSCYIAEELKNALLLGRVEVNINFNPTAQTEFSTLPNTFSTQFINCVKSEISRYDNSENKYKKVRLIL